MPKEEWGTKRLCPQCSTRFYDLQNDPFEMKNLAEQPEQKPNLARLRAALDAWMKQQGDKGIKTEMEAQEHQARARGRRRR